MADPTRGRISWAELKVGQKQGWQVDQKPGNWAIATLRLVTGDSNSTPLELPNWPQKSLQVMDEAGLTITNVDIKQSNDGVAYADMHQEADPTLTFSGLVAVMQADVFENPRYIRVTDAKLVGEDKALTVKVSAYTSR